MRTETKNKRLYGSKPKFMEENPLDKTVKKLRANGLMDPTVSEMCKDKITASPSISVVFLDLISVDRVG